MKPLFASVILDDAIDRPLDYLIPPHLLESLRLGQRVEVPLRNRLRKGTLIALKEVSEVSQVLPIESLLGEEPFFSEELFHLASWISRYYSTPLRKVLKLFLPKSVRKGMRAKEQLFIRSLLSSNALAELCTTLRQKQPAQAEVLETVLKFPKGLLLSELLLSTSRSAVTTLIKKKVLVSQKVSIDRSPLDGQEYFRTEAKDLTQEQAKALLKIEQTLDQGTFETHLIHGITGSGKTEIYLQAIDHALKLNKSALLLVPEIALTAQTIERLRSRFEEKIAILHHRLSDGERRDAWHQIRSGQIPIVVGARSALFSPLPRLGLIIVDEEHEGSYKQSDEAPSYHARDVAVMRGKLASATVVLGSATPSIESYYNASCGKYTLSNLTLRPDAARLPKVKIIDMKREFEKAKGFTLFSDPLIDAIKKRLSVGEQTLLFLNRRGYHTSQMCPKCGHTVQCPSCDVSLTFHHGENSLRCHLCDHHLTPPPRACPSCHAEGTLKYRGVGTEMVERSLHALLPEVRTLRLDADTTRHKGSHDILFKQFRTGKADILIGTQMIAKGLHFPAVTLVGILGADATLQLPDFRASEMAFQLITQVAGRSGRGPLCGEVLLQTHLPDHPVILRAAAQDYTGFYADEIAIREQFHYPPFTHLIKCTLSGPLAAQTESAANDYRTTLIHSLPSSCQILPVVPCGHARIKELYRFQFLIKTDRIFPLPTTPPMGGVRLIVDIDPLSTYF